MSGMREVFSDNNFNLTSCCVRCGRPVSRRENGTEIAPVLAVGTLTESGALDESAATLCSACVSAANFQLCYQSAASRSVSLSALGCIYQVVGLPREQLMIERLAQLLDQNVTSLA